MTGPTILTADRLFDATGTTTRTRPALGLADGRVSEVLDADAVPPGPDRLDFPGCTLLPGLIDTHVHLVFAALDTNDAVIEQLGRDTDDDLLARALANARAALRAGITTVRDCGGRNQVVKQAKDRLAAGTAEGCEVLSCGMPITTTLGHCHWLGLTADTHAAACDAARRMLAEGADFLKVMATGGNMTRTSDPMKAQFADATLKAIADIGRGAGRHTAAHVLSRAALPGAVAARVRTVEHCDWRVEENRYEFDPELARRMIDEGVFAGLTMSGLTRRSVAPEPAGDMAGPVRRLDARFASERRLIEAGVRFSLHSDAGVRRTPVESLALGLRAAEIELKLTPAEVLTAATATAADAIGLCDRGRLLPGLRADVLVVEGDPTRDLTALHRVRAVFQRGRRVV
jgi:imidazolonepropionase-like amidohydrolase